MNIKREVFLGFIIAVIVTLLSMFLYSSVISDLGFEKTVYQAFKGRFLHKIVTLSSLPNLLLFFLFLNSYKEYRARGVLLATIVTACVNMILLFS